jgi:hypothetical protein
MEVAVNLFWIALGMSGVLAMPPLPAEENRSESEMTPTEEAELPRGDEVPAGIINGEEASADDFPMTGGILMEATITFGTAGGYDLRNFVCSSTLIAPDVVMLAAHCVDPYAMTFGIGEMDNVEVRWSREADLSAHDGSQIAEWPSDSVVAADWVMHPDWDMTALETGLHENNDIALVFLEEPVLDTPHAYLITAQESDQIVVDAAVEVVGWGQQIATGFGETPPPDSYGHKRMGTSFINELAEFEMQVGAVEDDVRKCHGDSGGPTFLFVDSESEEKMRLIGVTSHAYDESDCASTGGVDTRVDAYLDWIEEELVSRCEDGSRAWCDEVGIVEAPLPASSDSDPADDDGRGGCACSSTSSTSGMSLLAVLGLLGLMGGRRRVGASNKG